MLLAANLTITEFMASNTSTLADKDGDYSDWIEIHNPGPSAASLNGYHLTDNPTNLSKWTFPDVTIPPDGYLVVFASNKNLRDPGQELHTNFNLNTSGDYLALVEPDALTILSQFGDEYPDQESDISYGVDPSASETTLRYFATPSPFHPNARSEVVINEIHYNPDIDTELVEFIELHNPGTAAVDLSNASFTNGISYTFAPGTSLAPGAYLVVTQNPAAFQKKFGASALGPWTGLLANDGETITLQNRSGGTLDKVDYKLGFPWPTVGDAPGYSIELINPDLDNNLGGNWRTHAPYNPGTGTTLFSNGGAWNFRKGTSEASTPKEAWRELNFPQDATWYSGAGPIGYDGNNAFSGSPQLADMRSLYSSFFMRKTFTIADPSQISSLRLEAMYDDGFAVWINGQWAHTQNVASTTPGDTANRNPNCTDLASGPARESNAFDTFLLNSAVLSYLVPGTNVIAVQVFNTNVGGSSDAFFDARLIATSGDSGGNSPTPAKKNSVFSNNAAPQIRQVSNSPQQPVAGQPVTITAKITDPDGVAAVALQYQIVDPGNYIALEDPAYNLPANWITLTMNDAGQNGDAIAGDALYTVVLPPSLQLHRRLIRYRITATDTKGASITAPYADDPQPNFAYYCYTAIPAWNAAIQPGSSDPTKNQVVTYDFNSMPPVPVYQLITKKQAHIDSQSIPNSTYGQYWGDSYLWSGTLVYDGVVYDHIHYRARGGMWRYAMGKNMWKFDFNRGHEFQARDQNGNLYSTGWKKLNLGANIQQGNFGQRGEQGLFEAVGFQLFNLAGSPASRTVPIHFRIVENASETNGTSNQYDDDFQGLYLAIEQMDGRFLDEHNLPDGNLYKMESGPGGGESNNQGPTQPSDNSDLIAFSNALSGTPSEQWWRDNVNLDQYFGYRAIVEAIHHWDIGFGKNYFFYHDPITGKWSQHPWDLDLTWTTTYEPGGGDAEPFKKMLAIPALNIEYQNRLREIRDLLFNTEQVGQMLDEYANLVDSPNPGASLVDADRAMWDYNPIMTSSYVNSEKAGAGRFYEAASTKTFRGMLQRLKNYVASRSTYLDNIAKDTAIPNKPSASYLGSPDYPINDLRFQSSAFSDPTGSFAAMQWRIAEVNAYQKYEINPNWLSNEITSYNSTITIPPESLTVGHTYRVRVRMKDSTGRWSNWSNPVQFVAGPASPGPVAQSLRVAELMYNPPLPPTGSPYDRGDFEFIELKNTGNQTLNLLNVSFSRGIQFLFGDIQLPPNQSVLVVKNLNAFASRYRTTGMIIAGQFTSGNLNDSGETLELLDAAGQLIQSFTYSGTWYPSANGLGYSLVPINPLASNDTLSSQSGWHPSRIADGTPGADETNLPDNSVLINEALTHSDSDSGDWIELLNNYHDPIDLTGWWLSDDPGNPAKYQIQPGSVILPNDLAVFTQSNHFGNPTAPGALQLFALSSLGGDEIVLSSATATGVFTGYRATQRLDAAKRNLTLGRYVTSTGDVDFTLLSTPTMGHPNSPPLVGPVVINEILYHPTADHDPFIELHNITDQPVQLFDPLHPDNTWRLAGGISYAFPTEQITLQPNEFILVVPIDPDAFRTKHSISPEIRIFGPFAGALSLTDENIKLIAPNQPASDGIVAYHTVDRVHYDTLPPWPTLPPGASLGRKSATQYANDPANWTTIPNGGNPGRDNFDSTPPTAIIAPVTPDPRNNSVTSIIITLSEPVTGFDLSHLILTRNGSVITFTDQTLTSSDGLTYTLANLDPITWIEGDYALTLNPAGITDSAGNALPAPPPENITVSSTTLPAQSPTDSFILLANSGNLQIYKNTAPPSPATFVVPLNQISNLNLTLGNYRFDNSLDDLNLTLTAHAPASPTLLLLNAPQHLQSLTIGDHAQVRLAPGSKHPLHTQSLIIAPDALLDVADASVVIYSQTPSETLTQVFHWIQTARTGGSWTGNGISTSLPTDSTGIGVALDDNNVLIRYTWTGDANLDGLVNADDYFLIDSGFVTQQGGYQNGDLNYDNLVNADDYFLIDSAFITQTGPLAAEQDLLTLHQPRKLNPPATLLSQLFSTKPLL